MLGQPGLGGLFRLLAFFDRQHHLVHLTRLPGELLQEVPDRLGLGFQRGVGRDGKVLLQWVEQKTNDAFGTAIVLPGAEGFAQDPLNELVLAKAMPGKPLRYYAGAAWSRAGEITSRAQWERQAQDIAARDASPVRVTIQPTK